MKTSIIIPVHNAEKYLCKCVRSIIDQGIGDLEILLIENGSDDSSYQVCLDICEKYDNVICIKSELKGVSIARNIGLDNAKGDIITFCDADDYYELDLLKIAISFFVDTGADIVVTGYYNVVDDHTRIRRCLNKNGKIGREEIERRIINDPRVLGSVCNKFYKKKIIGSTRFKEDITHMEDTFFNIELLENNSDTKCYYYGKCIYNYIQHDHSATNDAESIYSADGFLKYYLTKEMLLKKYEHSALLQRELKCSIASSAINTLYERSPEGIRRKHLVEQYINNSKYYLMCNYRYCFKHTIKMILWWFFCGKKKYIMDMDIL